MTIKTRIIRIGNSRGVRVPKALLEQAQLSDEVAVSAEPGRLIVMSAHRPRQGWAEAAQALAASGEDRLLDQPTATRFDREEWKW